MDLKIFKKIKKQYLIAILALGAAILLLSNLSLGTKENKPADTAETNSYKNINEPQELEHRLENIIKKISGITEAKVFVTYENSGVKRHASNIKDNAVTSGDNITVNKEETAVMEKSSSGEAPFVSEEIMPEVRGVMIVVSGLKALKTKQEITDAVSAVLGVPIHKVKVLTSD